MKPRSAPAVLGLAIAIPLLPSRIQEAYVADSGATAPVCADGQPRVCVTRVHAAALDRLVGPAREALAILSAKLPEPPVEVREAETRWVAGPQPPATVFVELSGNPDPRTIQRLRWALLEGAGTRPCIPLTSHEDVVAREQAGRLAMAAWLLEQAPPPEHYAAGQARQAWDLLRQLPPDEQRRRVIAARAAALACGGQDLIHVLRTRGSMLR